MEHLWTWGGKYFGYRDRDSLRTYRGYHVGHFVDDDAYGLDGKYLGEVINQRLIVRTSKRNQRSGRVTRYAKNMAYVKMVNYVGYVMYSGCVDFPAPENFENNR